RRLLINEVIQPVVEQQVCMAGPTDNGPVFRIVASIVVPWHFNGCPFLQVTGIFLVKGQWRIFRMSGQVKFTTTPGSGDGNPRLRRASEYLHALSSHYILICKRGMPAVWNMELIIETPEQGMPLIQCSMLENTE